MKSIKQLFSLKRHKSDGDISTKSRRAFSAGNLSNLGNLFLLKKTKSVSLVNDNTNSPRESLKFISDSLSTPRKSLKRPRTSEDNNNVIVKRLKNDECDKLETLSIQENDDYLTVSLRLSPEESLGLEIHPKWTFASDGVSSYYITRIIQGSVAAQSNLQVGDEIVQVNGEKLTENSQIFNQTDLELKIFRPKFKVPHLTGMKKFTQNDDKSPKKRMLSKFTQKYCSITGDLQISIQFYKGAGMKSLGFTVVGGRDSPKGSIGIYIKTVFDYGQAAELGCLKEGDEILSVNGRILKGLTHQEAVDLFKSVKNGYVFIEALRRDLRRLTQSF